MFMILRAGLVLLCFGLVVCAGMWILATAATIATDLSIPLALAVVCGGLTGCALCIFGLTHTLFPQEKVPCDDSSHSSSSSS